MYDLQTDASLACFDPNNPNININNIININNNNNNNNNSTNFDQNGFSLDTLNNNNNINNNIQQIDSNSMAIDFQNPNNINNDNNNDNNNWTVTNINNNYNQYDEDVHGTTTTSDLLTLLHLPRCTFASSSTTLLPPPPPPHTPPISFSKSSSPPPQSPPPTGLAAFLGEISPNMNMGMMMQENGSGSYDPLFHLNLPPQPSPLLRDLMFHGYPTNNGRINNGNCSLFAQMDDLEANNMNMNMNMNMNGISGIYQENNGEHMMNQNPIFEFTRGDDGKMVKSPKNFVTERQRRINFNSKYQQLRSLIPTPTKTDRASIVYDAIGYIKELKRTVGELKLLVEQKRISKNRTKRFKTEDHNLESETGGEHNNNNSHGVDLVKPDPDDAFAGSTQLRSSWLQRKCKDTEVDVRIVDDEVTIKLVQRKKINCLLSVSRTLDDLQLDLRHVAGGHVGDYYSYLFNSKICEGSTVYASAIANKLIEVVERQYAAASVAVAPTSSF
ncbi:hypothetical protein RND81_02G099700 [Saponaria officinalis]|uniref:BHLH domain-containing protein n=1 Tax=Saponaria officinalis TaxID=3572 RepID=A0AAW1MRT5_SAPOF